MIDREYREFERDLDLAYDEIRQKNQPITGLGFGARVVGRMNITGDDEVTEVHWVKYIAEPGQPLREVKMVTHMQHEPVGEPTLTEV